jgi:hypothetical protein
MAGEICLFMKEVDQMDGVDAFEVQTNRYWGNLANKTLESKTAPTSIWFP